MKLEKRKWLIKLRNEANLTQFEVAENIKFDRTTYTRTELGYSLSVKQAKKIGSFFGFPWTRFF